MQDISLTITNDGYSIHNCTASLVQLIAKMRSVTPDYEDRDLGQIVFHLFQMQQEMIQIAGQCAILLRFRLRTAHVKNAVSIVYHL